MSLMSPTNGTLLKFFIHILKLEVDGSNWVIFKDHFVFVLKLWQLLLVLKGGISLQVDVSKMEDYGTKLKQEMCDDVMRDMQKVPGHRHPGAHVGTSLKSLGFGLLPLCIH